ncbi:DUF3570 domain-containing protein [Psychromonas aquimarina]|uniref:DUF3570 domain-containing protein n=1 Tax=Psychromonas aquimarina TaxID=444919 RepID=UPI00040A11D6|nr:DUF3570 domain-containing protein [Psychromonas aquimarina]
MQLNNKHKNIRKLLKTAAGCLLGTSGAVNADSTTGFFSGWQTDIAGLVYSEVDRVSAWEPLINTRKTFDDDSVLGFKLVLDVLTGASPNGASPSDQIQTFTRPSGRGSYQSQPGEIPLDDTFHDTRVSFSANYEHGLGRVNKMLWGANISKEYDFFSTGLSALYIHDLNKRNTSLSIGISGEYNIITPEGGLVVPLSQMQAAGVQQNRGDSSDSRFLGELLAGISQVINRQMIAAFNYGYSQSDGYHNDPYKVVSVVDDVSGSLVPGETLSGTYLYESRPEQRTKHSLYSKIKRAFGDDSADISYRYMWDDWGINSHTLNLTYRSNFNGWYVEPHFRYYLQDAADFYRHSISESEAADIGPYLSADYRLAEMWSSTIGLKIGFKTPDGNRNTVRLEYYHQDGEQSPSDALGVQKNYDMFPTLDAFIVQYTYSF